MCVERWWAGLRSKSATTGEHVCLPRQNRHKPNGREYHGEPMVPREHAQEGGYLERRRLTVHIFPFVLLRYILAVIQYLWQDGARLDVRLEPDTRLPSL